MNSNPSNSISSIPQISDFVSHNHSTLNKIVNTIEPKIVLVDWHIVKKGEIHTPAT